VLVLLAIYLFSFAAARRLWCRFCPMGMIAGLFNRGGMLRLAKDPGKCSRCGACAEACPMAIGLVRDELARRDVSSFHCVLCLKCVEHCPRDACLGLDFAGRRAAESRFGGGLINCQ
jgi:polyferredoxin